MDVVGARQAWRAMELTAIVLIKPAATDELDRGPSDEDLLELVQRLASRWASAALGREPPPIWSWEPLVESGHISLAGLAAIIEVELADIEEERQALRQCLIEWRAASSARVNLRITIVWAKQMIEFSTETLPSGVSESRRAYGRQDQVADAVRQAKEARRQGRALRPHRR